MHLSLLLLLQLNHDMDINFAIWNPDLQVDIWYGSGLQGLCRRLTSYNLLYRSATMCDNLIVFGSGC